MNQVSLVGRVTKDIECKYTTTQKVVARFTLAVNRRKSDDGADFISCIVWNKTAEVMEKYVHKGDRIGILGRIRTGSYQKEKGDIVYTTEVVVDQMEFLESKKRDSEPARSAEAVDEMFEAVDEEIPF